MLFRIIDGLNTNRVMAIVSVAMAKLCVAVSLLSCESVDAPVSTSPESK